MKVWLDGLALLTPKRGGIGNYCYKLAIELAKLAGCSVEILYNKADLRWKPDLGLGYKQTTFPYRPLRRLFGWHGPALLPLEWLGVKGDIYHGTEGMLLPCGQMKTVLTVHDLEILSHPETTTAKERAKRIAALEYAVPKADAIITVSAFTRDDVIRHFPAAAAKTIAIPLAADPEYRPLGEGDPLLGLVRETYRLPERFILYLGGNYKRKNVAGMLKAYGQAIKNSVEHHFVIAGNGFETDADIGVVIEKYRLQNKVHFIGFVEQAHLPALYNLADLFMHVSFFEGFGLPPLEAMQCGTPAMVANTSSLPEVVGEGGLQVDPANIEMIADALSEFLLAPQARRDSLALAGMAQARKFSWQKTAAETLKVYQSLL
jgi:glycosyltransferase involved in cell wall biosynthesis